MKNLLLCFALGASLPAWAAELNCQAILTSRELLNGESAFKNEISEIVSSAVPSQYDDLKIKIGWGEANIISTLIIRKHDLATHQSIPRIPDPSAWGGAKSFDFTVAVLGTSKKAMGSSLERYRINAHSYGDETKYTLTLEAKAGTPVELLNLYVALSIAPFVDAVLFEQQIMPTKLSYPEEPIPLAEPEELRAIRNLRQLGNDKTKREEAVAEIKPGIVGLLESGKQFKYRGIMVTGFSEDLNVVDNSKAASFAVDYVFNVPSSRRP